MSTTWRTAVCLLLLFALTACVFPTPDPDAATPTPSPVSDDLLTPGPVCTPPACANGRLVCPDGEDCVGGCGVVCEPNVPTSDLVAPTDEAALADWLVAAYQDGRNPAAVRAALQAAGWQDAHNQWLSLDLDGDLLDDWAIVLLDREAEPLGFGNDPLGDFWLVSQAGIVFRQSEALPPEDPTSFAPTIFEQVDLTADRLPELVLRNQMCGAHTCSSSFRILSGVTGTVENIVDNGRDDFPGTISQTFAEVRYDDHQQDGDADFWVYGGLIGSVGAGIMRAYTQVWSWDGTAVTLADTILDYTTYRHHILYEANSELAEGHVAEALLLYERTINDSNLQNPYSFDGDDAAVYGDISQFAAVRLIYIDLLNGDVQRANGRLAWLQQTYPFTFAAQAGSQLLNEFNGVDSLPAICDRIALAAEQATDPTGSLDYFGYGNPSLTGADYCP